MSKIKILFFLAMCFVLTNSVAFGWDDTGHKLTTYIAWQQMTPAVRERAIKILLSAPEDSDLSVFYLQDSRSDAARQRELFMIASIWADIVRDRNFKNRYGKYHKSDWHYADTFWRGGGGDKVEILNDFSEPKGKAVEQLFAFDKVLRDPSASDAEKAIALAWVLHLGGDIHQPLHTSARVTDLEPKGDQGGNLFLLTPPGTPRDKQVNLHWFWDSIVGRNIPRLNDACDSDYLPAIAAQMMKKYPAAKMQSRLELGKFDAWQQESFKIAIVDLFPATLIRNQMPSDAYRKRAFQISEQQIALAGYRLGAMLNQIFGGQTTALMSREDYEKDKAHHVNKAKETGSKIGEGANDAWLWTKTRAVLMTTNDLRDSTINVDVIDGVITLKGTVSSVKEKMKAEQVAKGIEGMKGVKNALKVVPK